MLKHTATLYLSTVFIWGSTFFAIKFQLGEVPTEVSVAYRFALATLILMVWCWLRGLPMKFGFRQHLWILAQGLTLFGFNYLVVYWATSDLTSGLIAVVFSTIVLMNIANGALFFGKRTTVSVLAGALIGRIGAERAAYAMVLFPIVALGISTLFEGYQWSVEAVFGVALVLIGNILIIMSPEHFKRFHQMFRPASSRAT